MKLINYKIYFKDRPDEIVNRIFGILEHDDDIEEVQNNPEDDDIFFYIEADEDINNLKSVDNGEDFVVLFQTWSHTVLIAPSSSGELLYTDLPTFDEAVKQFIKERGEGSAIYSFDTEEELDAFMLGYQAAIGYVGEGYYFIR